MKKITTILVLLFFIFLSFFNSSFSQTFTKIDTGIIATDLGPSAGSSWGDYDNDGLLDLFVCNNTLNVGGTKNFLYHNEGNCYFTKIESGPIVTEIGSFGGSVWGDYNNDGYLDLVVTKRDGNVMLFHNNTNGGFEKVYTTPLSGLNEHFMGSSWIDLNNDGHLDLFLNSYGKNYLFQNQGDGNFFEINSPVLTTTGRNSVICSWADYDNDEDFDLFISVYVGTNSFYVNNGDGSFTLNYENNIINDDYSIGGSWGDCNNDGHLDLYVVNQDDQSTPNSLYMNNGDGTFEKVTSGDVVTDKGVSIGSSWGDFDNDGDLDLFVSNYNFQGHKNCLYINNGYGEFTKITEGKIVNDNGEDNTICDFDNDGDLDIFITNGGGFGTPSANYLYANDGNENNWININFIGTISNKNGIGVKVKAKANIFGSDVWQMRETSQQNGSFGHNSLRAHFGLGDATTMDSLVIIWPSRNTQVLINVPANQFFNISEPFTSQHDLTLLPNLAVMKSATNFTNFNPEISLRNIGSND